MPGGFTEGRVEALVAEILRAGRPLSLGDVMQRARIRPGERSAVKRVLRELVRRGKLSRARGRFSAPGAPSEPPGRERLAGGRETAARGGRTLVGTFTRARGGFGFVARPGRRGEDVYLPREEARKALDGDRVRVEIVAGPRGRASGRVVEVVERRRRLLLGVYHPRRRGSFVVPLDEKVEGPVAVDESRLAREGEVVKVALGPGPELEGRVIERVADPGDPRVEVLGIAYAYGFSEVLAEEVLEEAAAVPDRVRPEDRRGRRDLTGLRLITIDGEDARDFDDAVYVERLPGRGRRGGYRLVVAIADVSHYVRPGGALDAEALRRATSVYFPAQVLPMLPERLSNGICSLNPEVERLCVAADLALDARGEPAGPPQIYPAVMRSAARCTYGEVARVLSGDRVPHREFLRADLELMAELQERLTEMRRRRGAIDFDLPEAKVVLGEDGRPLAIERRPRNRAHRVVEEFMLAANEAVARHFGDRELPTIYRVHGLPDDEKLAAFLDLARAQGFEVPAEASAEPRALGRLLARFEGHPQQRALNQLLLRAMMQAVYSPENIGHYGLAAEHYLHFTSPIRRYPDLMVHRLLEAERGRGRERRAATPDLERVAAHASERERAAMQAEREVGAFYAALFMQDKVGERLEGVVASVVEFGLFVELKRWFVEGLVKLEDLGEGFRLDAGAHALVSRRGGRAYRVGDEVTVEVLAASPARRQIDLALVEAGEVRRAGRREGRRG